MAAPFRFFGSLLTFGGKIGQVRIGWRSQTTTCASSPRSERGSCRRRSSARGVERGRLFVVSGDDEAVADGGLGRVEFELLY